MCLLVVLRLQSLRFRYVVTVRILTLIDTCSFRYVTHELDALNTVGIVSVFYISTLEQSAWLWWWSGPSEHRAYTV